MRTAKQSMRAGDNTVTIETVPDLEVRTSPAAHSDSVGRWMGVTCHQREYGYVELRRHAAVLRQWPCWIVVGLVASLLASALLAAARAPVCECRTRVGVGRALNSQDSSF